MNPFASRVAVFQLLAAALLLGGVFAFGKLLSPMLPPFTGTVLRYGGAAVVLVPLALGEAARVKWAEWPRLVGVGLVGGFLFNGLLFWGLRFTPAADSVLAPAMMPLMMALAGALWFDQRPSRPQLLWMGLSLAGLAVIFASHIGGGGLARLGGDALHLAASASYAAYGIGCARLKGRHSPVLITATTAAASALAALPLAWYEGGLARVPTLPPAGWGAVAYLALLGTALGVLLWNRGVQALGASRAAIFMNLVPIAGLLMAMILLHERLHPAQGLGIALVLLGVWGATRAGRRVEAAPPR